MISRVNAEHWCTGKYSMWTITKAKNRILRQFKWMDNKLNSITWFITLTPRSWLNPTFISSSQRMVHKVNSNSRSRVLKVYLKLSGISSQQMQGAHLLSLHLKALLISSNHSYSQFKDRRVWEVKCYTKLKYQNIRPLASRPLAQLVIWYTSISQIPCSNSNNNSSSNSNWRQGRHSKLAQCVNQTKATKDDS